MCHTPLEHLDAIRQRLPEPLYRVIADQAPENQQLFLSLAWELAESGNPKRLLEDWLRTPPPTVVSDARAWLLIGIGLNSYGDPRSATEAIQRAIPALGGQRDLWRANAALWIYEEEPPTAERLAAEASNHPVAQALIAMVAKDFAAAQEAISGWRTKSTYEFMLRSSVLAQLLFIQGETGTAIEELRRLCGSSRSVSARVLLSTYLTYRAVSQGGVRYADAIEALTWATEARDIARVMMADAVDAIHAACEACGVMHDWRRLRELSSATPLGEATEDEASRPPIRNNYAIASACLGEVDSARSVLNDLSEFDRAFVEALIAEAVESPSPLVHQAWLIAWREAANDSQKIKAARNFLVSGGADREIDDFAQAHPADLGQFVEIRNALAFGPGETSAAVLGRLRGLADRYSYAAHRLADLYLQKKRVSDAVDVLHRASDQFQDQEFLLRASQILYRDGKTAEAIQDAERALTAGPWPGRPAAAELLFKMSLSDGDWAAVIKYGRILLEHAPDHAEIRWLMALAHERLDQQEDAIDLVVRDGEWIAAETKTQALQRIRLANVANLEQKAVEFAYWPTGAASSALGGSYSEALVLGVSGSIQTRSVIGNELNSDYLAAQGNDFEKEIVVDTSTINVLTLLPQYIRESLLGYVPNMSITSAAVADIRRGIEHSQLQTGLNTTITQDSEVVFVQTPTENLEATTARLKSLLELTRLCHVVDANGFDRRDLSGPTVVEKAADLDPWYECVKYAKEKRLALWCDDANLRRLARADSVVTFGTVDVLRKASVMSALNADALELSLIELIKAHCVDMPFDLARFRVAAEAEHWRPGGVWTSLSRAAVWQASPDGSLDLLISACTSAGASDGLIRAWVSAAAEGLSLASGANGTVPVARLVAELVLRLGGHAAAILDGAREGGAELLDRSLWRRAAELLHSTLLTQSGETVARDVLIDLASGLGGEDRLVATRVVLNPARRLAD